jgi:hypothetical protein
MGAKMNALIRKSVLASLFVVVCSTVVAAPVDPLVLVIHGIGGGNR